METNINGKELKKKKKRGYTLVVQAHTPSLNKKKKLKLALVFFYFCLKSR
jgi:hypothetical protein